LIYRLSAPHVLVGAGAASLMLIYVMIPANTFYRWYGSPKLGSSAPQSVVYLFILFLLFVAAAYLGKSALRRGIALSTERPVPGWLLRGALCVAVLAYLVWFGLGLQRAGGPVALISTYLVEPFTVKGTLLRTVPGLTTLTQLAVAAIPIILCYHCSRGLNRFLILIVLCLAAMRSFLFSERLALVEIALPIVFILLASRRPSARSAFAYGAVMLLGIFAFFTLNEMRRSFVFLEPMSTAETLIMGARRFLGYYLTSLNNAVFAVGELAFAAPLSRSLAFLWEFPGLDGLYDHVVGGGTTAISMPYELRLHGLNPEYNTATALGYWVVEFGLVGTPLIVIVVGVISGVLYRAAAHDGLAMALYSVWVVGLFEFCRIDYFTTTRLFPAYVLFVATWLLMALPRAANNVRVDNDRHIRVAS
jgi:oligosaccharide repeat unit polymerase